MGGSHVAGENKRSLSSSWRLWLCSISRPCFSECEGGGKRKRKRRRMKRGKIEESAKGESGSEEGERTEDEGEKVERGGWKGRGRRRGRVRRKGRVRGKRRVGVKREKGERFLKGEEMTGAILLNAYRMSKDRGLC